MVAVSLGFLMQVEGLRPGRFSNRLSRPFDEALPGEFVARITTMNETHLAALLGQGSDPAVLLDGGRGVVFGTVAAEEGEQAGRKGRAGTGQRAEEHGVGMFREFLFNQAFEAENAVLRRGDLADERVDEQCVGLEHGLVGAHGHGVADHLETLFDDFRAAALSGIIELLDGRRPRFSQGLEVGPIHQEIAGERRVKVAPAQFKRLREDFLEGLGEPVGEVGADINELTAFLGEQGDLVGERIMRGPWLEPSVPLKDEKIQRAGVSPVILGPGGAEAFAVFFDDGGVDEVEAQEIELAEEMDEVLARLLDADGGGCALGQGFPDFPRPGHERFGAGRDFGLGEDRCRGVQETDVNARVGTIQADEEVVFHGFDGFLDWLDTRAYPCDGFIGMSFSITTEESLLDKPRSCDRTLCSYPLARTSHHSPGRRRRGDSSWGN